MTTYGLVVRPALDVAHDRCRVLMICILGVVCSVAPGSISAKGGTE